MAKWHTPAKPASGVSRPDVAGRLDLTNVSAMQRRDASCIPQIGAATTNTRGNPDPFIIQIVETP